MNAPLKKPFDTFFGTLANQVRLDILSQLMSGSRSVGQLVKVTGHSQPTISRGLTRLLRCGFVSKKAEGKFRIYTINSKTIKPLFTLMKSHTKAYCSKVKN
jgi:ArsR family transcriptional regulator, cadmium/lead-responsive transcriptional repressor